VGPAAAETLPQALLRTYQGNPQLNAERARLRGVDEGVPQALPGYRPQLLATLTGGLQQIRVLLPDNTSFLRRRRWVPGS
jgi:outer membrane protein